MGWPAEWREEFETFKADQEEKSRRARWDTWDDDLRRHALFASSERRRVEQKKWRAEAECARARRNSLMMRQAIPIDDEVQPEPSTATSEREEEAHNWMEGARIGEASHPGPWTGKRGQYPHLLQQANPGGNHAPGWRHNDEQAPTMQRGVWGAPTAFAGALAEGIRPGPNPSADLIGNRPGGNGGRNRQPSAMISSNMSRAGTAQRTNSYEAEP